MKRQFAEQYRNLEQWHWWFRGRQRILETVLRRELREKSTLRIVSVGCGPAEGLAWLARLTDSQGWIVGLDSDPLHARRLNSGLEYVVGKLEAVPFASRTFDVVLVLDVLEHLDDDTSGLREAARLIAPGGILMVTVPALPSLWGGQDVVSNHYRRYTKHTLRRTFRQADLPEPRLEYFNVLLFPPIAMVRWARRAIGLGLRSRSDFDGSRPGLMNETLASLFALERHWIGRVPMPVGVSMLATTQVS